MNRLLQFLYARYTEHKTWWNILFFFFASSEEEEEEEDYKRADTFDFYSEWSVLGEIHWCRNLFIIIRLHLYFAKTRTADPSSIYLSIHWLLVDDDRRPEEIKTMLITVFYFKHQLMKIQKLMKNKKTHSIGNLWWNAESNRDVWSEQKKNRNRNKENIIVHPWYELLVCVRVCGVKELRDEMINAKCD